MMNTIKKVNISKRGFTLVEMMVSVAIFSIIMVVGIGSLVSMMDKYQVSQQEKEASDSLNFVLETITREIRLGSEYYSYLSTTDNSFSPPALESVQNGNAEKSNGPLIGFKAGDSRGYIVYAIESSNKTLYRNKYDYTSRALLSSEPLTDSSQVIIEQARVRVLNAEDPDDLKQPLVWIQFLAYPPARPDSKKVIQTLVSQRVLDA